MTAMVQMANYYNRPLRYVSAGPSTAITNTNTESVLDQVFTYPSMAGRDTEAPTLIRMKAWGIVSTGLVNLGLTLNVRWGGVSGTILASTGAITLASSLSQQAWNAEMTCQLTAGGASGSMESQGFLSVTAGLLSISAASMANVSTIGISTVAANDLVMTAQWTTAAAANSIQSRLMYVLVDGP
jgi:hypothetical protein